MPVLRPPGEGNCFAIQVPTAESDPATPAPAARAKAGLHGDTITAITGGSLRLPHHLASQIEPILQNQPGSGGCGRGVGGRACRDEGSVQSHADLTAGGQEQRYLRPGVSRPSSRAIGG